MERNERQQVESDLKLRAAVKCAANALSSADYLLVVAGAGMGKDSGLSTFDDLRASETLAKSGLSYESFSSPNALKEIDHDLVFGFWGQQYNSFADARPHAGYDVLARWCNGEQIGRPSQVDGLDRYFVWTTNIDRHFHRVSALSIRPSRIHEVHGCMSQWQCGKIPACTQEVWSIPPNFRFAIHEGHDGSWRAGRRDAIL